MVKSLKMKFNQTQRCDPVDKFSCQAKDCFCSVRNSKHPIIKVIRNLVSFICEDISKISKNNNNNNNKVQCKA